VVCAYLLGRAGIAEYLQPRRDQERRLHNECGLDLAADQPSNAEGKKHKFIPSAGLMAIAPQSCVPGRLEPGKSPVLHSVSCFLLLCPLLPSQHHFSSTLQGQFLEVKMVLQTPSFFGCSGEGFSGDR